MAQPFNHKPTYSYTEMEMSKPVIKPEEQIALPSAPILAPDIETTSVPDPNESHTNKPIQTGFPTSEKKNFGILLKSIFRSIVLQDKRLTLLMIGSHTVIGLLILSLYFGIGYDASKVMSNVGCIFFTLMFITFTAMMPTILTFPTEMESVREHLHNGYSLTAYYFAKTLMDLPLLIVFSGVYALIVYLITGQPTEPGRVLMFTSINILTALVAQSLGLLIGAAVKIETGVYLGTIITIPTLLFSGFFVNFKVIPIWLQWVTYLSYVRYGFEGAMLSIYGFGREPLNCYDNYCHFRNPHVFLREMAMESAMFWIDIGALGALFFVIRVMSYIVLRSKLRLTLDNQLRWR